MLPLGWRSIGPDRGGRSIAVAGHSGRPFEYYFGATGGGLFTEDLARLNTELNRADLPRVVIRDRLITE